MERFSYICIRHAAKAYGAYPKRRVEDNAPYPADLNRYCRSYSPLDTFLKTPNPAFFASEIDAFFGELNVEKMRRTGFLHAGHWVKGAAESGRRSVNFPPHTLQLPSHSSYS